MTALPHEHAHGLVIQRITPPLRLADFKLIAFDMDSTLISIECIEHRIEQRSGKHRRAQVAHAFRINDAVQRYDRDFGRAATDVEHHRAACLVHRHAGAYRGGLERAPQLVQQAGLARQRLQVQQLAGACRTQLQKTLEGTQVLDRRQLPRVALGDLRPGKRLLTFNAQRGFASPTKWMPMDYCRSQRKRLLQELSHQLSLSPPMA